MCKHVPFLFRPIARKICDGIKAGFIRPRLKEHVAYIEQYLSEHDYVAGAFSFADIQLAFALEGLSSNASSTFPQIQRYLQRLQQREAYQCAKAKGLG